MASLESPSNDASAAGTRTSTRVRRHTERFASSAATNGKRKRQDEMDGDDDAADDDVSDIDEDTSGEELDEEERRQPAKKSRQRQSAPARKPAQKKPKVNGVSLPIRAVNAPTKKRVTKKGAGVDSADAEAAGGLYAELYARSTPVEGIISQWIESFRENEALSLSHLINFALKCAGCNGKVTEHDMEDYDAATSRITDLQEEYQASRPTDYPLIAKGKGTNGFKLAMMGFTEYLVQALGATGILWDQQELIDNIQAWLSTMTTATNRAFRHTSTLMCLSVITGLCDVAKDLAEKSTSNQRHAESERKKSRVNKERVKNLEAKVTESGKNLEIVEALLKDWFDTIFIHRYRDVDGAIRRECVASLGSWIVKMPDVFFDGQHLRYLGWLLSDANAGVRLENLKQLRRLYSDASKVGGLKTFTERFRERLVEIATSDSDPNVRVAGIELLDILRENGLLEPDDIDAAGRLMFHDDIRTRKAVAKFFAQNVIDLYDSKVEELGGSEALVEALPEVADSNVEAPRLEWLKFKSLAEMLESYDQEEVGLPTQIRKSRADSSFILHAAGTESRFTLAVDVLYDRLTGLEEWQALAGYLLSDRSERRQKRKSTDTLTVFKRECTLTDIQETILLEVLNASVKRALNDLAEHLAVNKSRMTKREKEKVQEDQEEIVRNLTDLIPKLLKKFGENPNTAAAILRLEGVLALPSLQSLRQDSATSAAMMDDLSKQFMSHGTDEVLAPATSAILLAKSYGELDETAADKLASLWEEVVGNLAELLDVRTIAVRGASQTEELLALSNNLLRIVRLSTVSDCTLPLEDDSVAPDNGKDGSQYNGAIDFIIDLVQRAMSAGHVLDREDAGLEDEIAARAAEAALSYFRWQFMSIISSVTTGTTPEIAADALETFAGRRDTYASNLTRVIESRKPGEQVTVSLAGCLLDLYTSAAVLRTVVAKPGMSDEYTVLILELDTPDEQAVMKVFGALEKDFAKLTRRKIETADSDFVNGDVNADPVDDDPLSDSDSDSDVAAEPANKDLSSQQRRTIKRMQPLLAEERLCQLASKLIYALTAGVINNGATRRRLERNRTRLGPNYKEVMAYLDMGKVAARKKAKANVKGNTGPMPAKQRDRKDPKSHAIIAEDDVEDEIEDPIDEEQQEEEEDDEPQDVDQDDNEMAGSVIGD